jgi:hypothetical protein
MIILDYVKTLYEWPCLACLKGRAKDGHLPEWGGREGNWQGPETPFKFCLNHGTYWPTSSVLARKYSDIQARALVKILMASEAEVDLLGGWRAPRPRPPAPARARLNLTHIIKNEK